MQETAAPPKIAPEVGWRKLGSGMDKAAYLSPDGSHVVLVADGHPAGHLLMDWVAESRRVGSPHMPVFLSDVVVNKKAQRYMVRMEKLKKITNAELIDLLDWLDREYPSRVGLSRIAPTPAGVKSLIAQIERGAKYEISDYRVRALLDLQRMQPRFLSDWVEISLLSRRKNHVLDLHAENIMLRETGAPMLVITDPW